MGRRAKSPEEEQQPSLFGVRGAERPAREQTEPDAAENTVATDPAWRLPANSPGVRKAMETILIRPKENRVTLQCRRFFNVLLRHAQTDPAPAGSYQTIPLRKFTQDLEFESRNMEHLVEVLNQMLATVVNWGDSAKNLKGTRYRWSGCALLAFASIEKQDGGRAMLKYDFHKELKDHLLNPQVYAFISLEMNARLRTHSALALYELGVKYLSNRNGLTMRMPWRDWVAPLTGNPDTSEELQYKYFARDVLKPALKEVNETQDEFEIVPLVEKVGRRVDTLQFAVRRKTAQQTADTSRLAELEVENLTLVGQLINHKVPQHTAEKFVLEYGATKVAAALSAFESRSAAAKAQPVRNPTGYFKTLLDKSETVREAPPQDIVDIAAKSTTATPWRTKSQEEEESAFAVKLHRYLAHRAKQRLREFQAMPPEDRQRLLEEFEETRLQALSAPVRRVWEQFRKAGLQGNLPPFLVPPFETWLVREESAPSREEVEVWASVNTGVAS